MYILSIVKFLINLYNSVRITLSKYRDCGLKVAAVNSTNHQNEGINQKKNTAFKSSLGMNLLSASGALMQGIENKGYVVSFLIQDGLGMTLPRTLTGFYRDREVTGEYNYKEGLEVLGREGMTGPFMMSVAPFMLWLTGKFCKSAGTNTRLIKIIGNNFKSMLKDANFNNAVKQDKAAFIEEYENPSDEGPFVRKRILVVDDDTQQLMQIKELLEEFYQVTVVKSGQSALKYLSRKEVDLILLDYMMPDMDGPETLDKLRENERTADIPVVFLSGVKEKSKIIETITELKPQGYVVKPAKKSELVAKIIDILG